MFETELHLTRLIVGSFDMKASRVQECGSVDMSKYGHSQSGKIKSKHHVFILHFSVVVLFYITLKMCCCFDLQL